jgi:hypothetical protein
MHRQAGRYYELDRTAEVLLRVPRSKADMAEFEAIQLLRANALRDLGLPDQAATAFVALRDERAHRNDPSVGEAMSRAEFLAIDERLAAHQYDEAGKLFDWFSKDLDAPTWFPFNLYGGVVRQARGDTTGAVPLLENAARLLLQSSDHAAWAFRDEAERRRQVTWLAESLLRAGRTDLALDVAGMLADAPDRRSPHDRAAAQARPAAASGTPACEDPRRCAWARRRRRFLVGGGLDARRPRHAAPSPTAPACCASSPAGPPTRRFVTLRNAKTAHGDGAGRRAR